MPYMVTFTMNIPQMLAYIPYMDPMGISMRLLSQALQPEGTPGGGPDGQLEFATTKRRWAVTRVVPRGWFWPATNSVFFLGGEVAGVG